MTKNSTSLYPFSYLPLHTEVIQSLPPHIFCAIPSELASFSMGIMWEQMWQIANTLRPSLLWLDALVHHIPTVLVFYCIIQRYPVLPAKFPYSTYFFAYRLHQRMTIHLSGINNGQLCMFAERGLIALHRLPPQDVHAFNKFQHVYAQLLDCDIGPGKRG